MTTPARLIVIIGAPTALLLGIATAGPEPVGFWVPDGFVAQADTLIARGNLALQCSDRDSIAVRFEGGSAGEQFYNLSYLRGDVRRFNASPEAARSPFLVEGCRLRGVDPFYHRVDLPYNRLPRWKGDVLYTFDGQTTTIEGGRDQQLEVRHPVDGGDAAHRSVRISPDERGARAYAPLIQLRRPRTPEVMTDLFFVGQAAVLAERIDPGRDDRVRVNGLDVPPGRMLRLESGDWLEYEMPGAPGFPSRYTYLVETGDRARVASFTRTHDTQVDRLFPAARLRPFLEPFSQAMDLALQSIPAGDDPESPIANLDVRLTLDRELSGHADERLAAWCTRNRHPTRPRVVSMIVMDAFSGAVRAMPSCPGEPELAPFEPIWGRTRDGLLRNQNLVPHPIGSAGKPFWAAAVATTYPNFLDLRVPSHDAGPAASALGCPLRVPYNDPHGAGAPVGLEEFIERSCNRYLIELATAALAVRTQPGRPDCRSALGIGRLRDCFDAPRDTARAARLQFCDQIINVVLSTELEAVGESCAQLELLDSKFAPGPVFTGLTNVATYRDMSPAITDAERGARLDEGYRAERYRVDAWRRVLGQIQAAGDTAHLMQTRLRFASISPQAANLALNTVEELRTDWVNLLLGGENSRWSNFELAEALGRLMTGRVFAGEFVDSAGWGWTQKPAALIEEEQLHPGVRRRILHAMELVPATGTARGLAGSIDDLRRRINGIRPDRPWQVFVFAKTGTPAIEKFLTSGQRRLVLELNAAGDLRWDAASRRIEIRPSAEQRIRRTYGAPTLQWLRTDVFQPIERDPEAFLATRSQRPDHPLHLDERGRLIAQPGDDLRLSRQGGVLILGVLAVAPEAAEAALRRADWISACSIDPELRSNILRVPPADLLDAENAVALSIALFVDDLPVGQGSGQAVDLARNIFDPIAAYIEKEVRRRVASGAP